MELKKFAVFRQLSDNVLKNISSIIEERIKKAK